MVRRRSKRQYMGRVLICLGLFLRILQIIAGVQLGISLFLNINITTVAVCLIAGGLCVFAVERMNLTSVFALLCAVSVLSSTVFSKNSTFATIFLMLSFLSFSLILISMKRLYRTVAGVAILVIAVFLLLHTSQMLSFDPVVITVLLSAVYLIEGIGLFV